MSPRVTDPALERLRRRLRRAESLASRASDVQTLGASPRAAGALALGAIAVVERAYEVALANGGTSEGAPGLRPEYHESYYGAYFRDTDGNKLCVACHSPGD